MELTKLLLSDHPEKIWMVETGIASYVALRISEVFEREPGRMSRGSMMQGNDREILKDAGRALPPSRRISPTGGPDFCAI